MIEIGASVGAGAGSSAVSSALRKSLQKAMLVVVEGDTSPKQLKFAYNPTELSTSKSAKWSRPTTKDKDASKPEFNGVDPQTVGMEIFFDAWEDQGDVSASVKTLFEWTKPTTSSWSKGQSNPPVLAFQWGSNKILADFRGFLKSVSAKYTLFRSDGVPLRATATISLEEIPHPSGKQNPTSGSLNSRRSHVVADGDSLHSIAYREYGEPAFWRSIAIFNGIDDPLRLRSGTRILLPTPIEASALAAVNADA